MIHFLAPSPVRSSNNFAGCADIGETKTLIKVGEGSVQESNHLIFTTSSMQLRATQGTKRQNTMQLKFPQYCDNIYAFMLGSNALWNCINALKV